MSARVLQLAHVTPSADYLRGWGSFDLIKEVCGRPPLRSIQLGAWYLAPWRTPDAVALWESRHGVVEVVDEAHLLRLAGADVDRVKAAHAERRGELW